MQSFDLAQKDLPKYPLTARMERLEQATVD